MQVIDRVGNTSILELGPEGRFVVARNGRELLTVDGATEEVAISGIVSTAAEAGGDHPGLAAHTALGLAPSHDHAFADLEHGHPHDHDGDYALDDHAHALVDADVPATIAREADVTEAIAAHIQAATHNAAPAATELYAVGDLYLTTRTGDPASLLGYGTWALWGIGRFVVGADPASESAGDTVGASTHGHVVTQAADHGALSHTGATVANHVVTQPSAHADHAAQAHSAHAGATVSNHAVTQPAAHADHGPLAHSAHAGAAVANHADVTNHVHGEQLQGGTTGTTTGTHVMGSAATGGSLRSAGQSTLNPTSGGVAAQVHAVTQPSAHSDHAAFSHAAHSGTGVDAHTVGQASGHTDHAALSHGAHSGTGVDAHTVGQATQHAAQSHTGAAVAVGTNTPPGIKAFMWRRAA